MRPLNALYEYHLSCFGARAVVVAKTQDEAVRKARKVNPWFDHHYRKGGAVKLERLVALEVGV
jgi:hypothetical protein